MQRASRVRPSELGPRTEHESESHAQSQAIWRCTVPVADGDGAHLQGALLLTEEWSPDLEQFDPTEREAFRIVMLSRATTIPNSALAPGVAVCIPSSDLSPLRLVQERAPHHKKADTPSEAPVLSRSQNASLSSGQIVANPPLELAPTDVFPRGEAAPRFQLLGTALLDQQRSQPYLQALAVALAAPVDPSDRLEFRVALQSLRQVVLAADKAPRPHDASLLGLERRDSVGARLTRLADADTTGAFAEIASHLYTSPINVAEDVYLCRALAERSREALELAGMRAYLRDAAVPENAGAELAKDRILTAEQLSFALLVAEPDRWPGMRAAFNRFHQEYRTAYIEHHHRHWEEALMLHGQLMDMTAHAHALRRLNRLRELGEPLGESALAEYDELPQRIGACLRSTSLDGELRDRTRCPECAISMADQLPWEAVQRVKHHLQRALDQQLQRLSSKAVRQVLVSSGEARIQEFIQIVQATQVQTLAHVLDDELLCFLRRFLVEARVHSLITPLLARLQSITPDVDDETVETVTTEVGRIIQSAFADAGLALPENVRLELGPGVSPEETSA